METLPTAQQAREKIDMAKTAAALVEWDTISRRLIEAINTGNSECHFETMLNPNREKLISIGYKVVSTVDPREGGNSCCVQW